MKTFLNEDFLLENETARQLYHDYAKKMPIIDYHNHLSPYEIAMDKPFENIAKVWLNGDHYKWRAMRTNGIEEKYITGEASDWEKFEKWAQTVPYTMRNPLYHWTHLELQRYFGITKLLNKDSAKEIWDQTNEHLGKDTYSVRSLLHKMNVEVICTTDDPVDDLRYHKMLAPPEQEILVLPTFRADKAMAFDNVETYNKYLNELASVAEQDIDSLSDLYEALQKRHDFFAERGCKLSDHGLEEFYAEDYTEQEVIEIFARLRSGKEVSIADSQKLKSDILYHLAVMDHAKGWTQQFHVGAIRNNNARMLAKLGPDTGWDSIGDFEMARPMSRFLDRLDSEDRLAKTILYNLNPRDNELFATMAGNFNDGSVAGKVQFGSGWWFNDQIDGMERQMNALSNMGLISRFVGMLTDSRSFLSYPRHEYFRRILSNLFGKDVENGELPNDIPWIGKIIQDISYNNANKFFGFQENKIL